MSRFSLIINPYCTETFIKRGSRSTAQQYEEECTFLQKEVMYLLQTPLVILRTSRYVCSSQNDSEKEMKFPCCTVETKIL